eukprot:TRINITY_DN66366_c3_g6_i1.p1 TRINITY_DN66366_c3_g6~~TRINITY_DN66366_c3_g6_i1.p1  ORF type:complete len:431 (-),score=234.97 TRINITY_DN66366_c3_g6_i1:30-1301(-)
MDPLTLLRSYTTNKLPILEDGDELVFGEHRVPKKAKTAYRKKNSEEFYTLEALWFYSKHSHLSLKDYVVKLRSAGVQGVIHGDKKALQQYLLSEVETTDSIDRNALMMDLAEDDDDDAASGQSSQSRKRKTASSSASASAASSSSSSSSSLSSSSKRARNAGAKRVEDMTPLERVQHYEIPISTRESIMSVPGKDFSSILTQFNEVRRKADELTKQNERKQKREAKLARRQSRLLRLRKEAQKDPSKRKPSQIPIIIVPSAPTSLLTLENALYFLQNGEYKSREEAQALNAKNNISRLSKFITIKRSALCDPAAEAIYHVYSDAKLLSKADWDRVVAVFAHGAEWQFSGWPFKSPAHLFENICGFHVHWNDVPLHKNIAKWNVNKLALGKQKRYQDKSLVLDFWGKVKLFIDARPKLANKLIY